MKRRSVEAPDVLLELLEEEVVVYVSTGVFRGQLLEVGPEFLTLYRRSRLSPDGTTGPGEVLIARAHVVAVWSRADLEDRT